MGDLMQEMKKDYQKMIQFAENAAKTPTDMRGILEINKSFFSNMKRLFEHGTDKEKAEAVALFSEVAKFFTEQAKKMSKNTLFTEKGLKTLSESPHFFSPEQWKIMQDLKNGMQGLKEDIKSSILKEE